MVSVLADIAHYARLSLIWHHVQACMTSFSTNNLSRLKLYIIKRKFKFLSWICHYFISWSEKMKYACFASLDEINGIFIPKIWISSMYLTKPHSAIGSTSDCRSRDCEFDPSLVPYFRGDWSWNILWSFSSLRWFDKGWCQLQAQVCAWSTV